MTTYELKNIAILNIKGIDYRCILWGIRTTLRFHVNGKFNDILVHLKLGKFYCKWFVMIFFFI